MQFRQLTAHLSIKTAELVVLLLQLKSNYHNNTEIYLQKFAAVDNINKEMEQLTNKSSKSNEIGKVVAVLFTCAA